MDTGADEDVAAGSGEVRIMAWGDDPWGLFEWWELPTYQIEIELTTGNWTDISADCMHVNISRQQGSIDSGISVGTAEFLMRNDEGKYSPDNSGSAYYPNLKINKNIRMKATCLSVEYFLFAGLTDGYSVDPTRGSRTCIIQCSDKIKMLQYRNITLPLKTNINTTTLFEDILTGAGITSGMRSIDALYDTVSFAWFKERRPIEVLNELIMFGNYSAYVSPAGVLTIKSRYTGLAGTSLATHDNRFMEFSYNLTSDKVANHIAISGQPRIQSDTVAVMASISESVIILSGQTVIFTLEYYDSVTKERGIPANNMVTPVATTDYTANTALDGSGTDKTGQVSVVATFQGASVDCEITNNDAAYVYLTMFQVRGTPIQKQAAISAATDDATSQTTYGQRDYTLESDYISTLRYATDYSEHLLITKKTPHHDVSVGIKNEWPDMFILEIGDIITLVEPISGINGKYVIQSIMHDIVTFDGLEHTTSYQVTQWVNTEYLVLDETTLGQLDNRKLAC